MFRIFLASFFALELHRPLVPNQVLRSMDIFFTSFFAFELAVNAYSFWFMPFVTNLWWFFPPFRTSNSRPCL